MNAPIGLDADPYHLLSATDRDHLLAAALVVADRDTLPAGATVGDAVGRLTGSTPTRKTTGKSLARLEDEGYISRTDEEPAGQGEGVDVTDDGIRVLRRGATRLDAATLGGDGSE